jgi:hypothetical protein
MTEANFGTMNTVGVDYMEEKVSVTSWVGAVLPIMAQVNSESKGSEL